MVEPVKFLAGHELAEQFFVRSVNVAEQGTGIVDFAAMALEIQKTAGPRSIVQLLEKGHARQMAAAKAASIALEHGSDDENRVFVVHEGIQSAEVLVGQPVS